MNFDLTQPVTWSDIISASASIFTFIAVIVAMFGNRNGSKQLKASLKIQEQSKNVELLDQRIAIVEALKRDDPISSLKVRLLFDENVWKSYQELLAVKKQQMQARSDERRYFQLAQEQLKDIHKDLPPSYDLEGYLGHLMANEMDGEFDKFCNSNEVVECIKDNNGEIIETYTYNYAKIIEQESEISEKIHSTREKLLSLAEQYIADSIAPVTDKRHG